MSAPVCHKCSRCGVLLVVGENWYSCRKRFHHYICKSCDMKEVSERRRRHRALKPIQVKKCRVCGSELVLEVNWKKAYGRFCTHCYVRQPRVIEGVREYRKKNPDRCK